MAEVWRHLLMVYDVADHTDRILLEPTFDDESTPTFILASEQDPFGYTPVFIAGIDFPFTMIKVERQFPKRFDPSLEGEYDPVVDNWISDSIMKAWDLAEIKKLRKQHVKRGRRLTILNGRDRLNGVLTHVAGSPAVPVTSLPHRLIEVAGRDAFSIFVVKNEIVHELDFSGLLDDDSTIVSKIAQLIKSLDRDSKSVIRPTQIVVRRKCLVSERDLNALQKITKAKKIVYITEKQARTRHHKRWFSGEDPEWLIPYSDYSRWF